MRTTLIVVLAVLLLGGAWSGQDVTVSFAEQVSPTAAALVIANEVLARATPAPVANPELALGRVTIMPGAAIPTHFHPGAQIVAIVQGELADTVFTEEVAWY